MKVYTKEEVEELIDDWCSDNYGYSIPIDKDEPTIQELKQKFEN